MTIKREIRAGIPAEIRADDDGILVTGHAAIFNSEAVIGDMFREVIKPGAFSKAIKRDDVLFLVNHEGLPLARTRSGTLKLSEDDKGLHIETQLDPNDPDVKALKPKMERGDMDEMSFAFFPVVQEWDDSGEMPLRTIMEAELMDVSIVNRPAYEGTDIGLRSLEVSKESLVDHQEQVRKESNFKATRKRFELKEYLAVKQGKIKPREKGE